MHEHNVVNLVERGTRQSQSAASRARNRIRYFVTGCSNVTGPWIGPGDMLIISTSSDL